MVGWLVGWLFVRQREREMQTVAPLTMLQVFERPHKKCPRLRRSSAKCPCERGPKLLGERPPCLPMAAGMQTDAALRISFREASLACQTALSLPTTHMSADRLAPAVRERALAMQREARVALAKAHASLERFRASRDWWVACRVVVLYGRMRNLLFFQRLREWHGYASAFYAGPCWTLVQAAVAALASDERVLAPAFLGALGALGAHMCGALECVARLAQRAAEALYPVMARGHYGSLVPVVYAVCAVALCLTHEARAAWADGHQWLVLLRPLLAASKRTELEWEPVAAVAPLAAWTSFDNRALVGAVMEHRAFDADAVMDTLVDRGPSSMAPSRPHKTHDTIDDHRKGERKDKKAKKEKKKRRALEPPPPVLPVEPNVTQSFFASAPPPQQQQAPAKKRQLVSGDDFLALLKGAK